MKELFHAALEREPHERDAFLETACRAEVEAEALRNEINRLLAAHADAGGFIEVSPAAAADHVPRSIGRYEVGRLLGTGGMGVVYLARDTELGRDIALKLATGSDHDAHARLRREAQNASQLNHPHICTIFEVGIHDGQPFIAMEYVDGRRLSDLIPPEGVPLPQVVRFGAQIADALAHAHASGVTHRDLKTANIVLSKDGRAKVLDFGVARRLAASRLKDLSESTASVRAEGVVGTLAWLPPEVLRGEPADERGDIWALGVLLYEMTCGVRPFTGATGFELTGAILHGPVPPFPARVSASLCGVIERCLEKDPRQRYQHAGEVRAALERLRHEIDRAGTPPSRRTRIAAVAALIVFATLLTAAGFWLRTQEGPARPAEASVAVGASGHPAIAIMSFEVAGTSDADSEWLARGVPSMLLTGLAQTRGLDLVSSRRLDDAARQIGAGPVASLDRSGAAAVARRAGAGAVVVGSVFRSGAEIRIDAQMEDLATGRVLVAESVRGGDLFSLVDQLAFRIRDEVGLRDESGVRGVAAVSSSSLDAYKLFAQGAEAYQNIRLGDARRLLEEAVRVDPQFASAHLYLGMVSYLTGRHGDRQQHFARAAEHADRLSDRQRYLLRAEIARDGGDGAEAERVLDRLFAEFPDWYDGYATALELYAPISGLVYRPEKRLALIRRGVEAQPDAANMRNIYGYAFLEGGELSRALEQFEVYARLIPNEPNPYDSLGEAYLAMGMPERAIELLTRALTVDPDFYQSHNTRAVGLAMLGRLDEAVAEPSTEFTLRAFLLMRTGRFRDAASTLASGIKAPIENRSIVGEMSGHMMASLLALEQRRYPQALSAVEDARRVLAQLPRPRQRVHLVLGELMSGLAETRAGRLERARAHLASQESLYNRASPFENAWHATLEGEIALAEKRPADAVDSFEAASRSRAWISLYLDYPWALMRDIGARDGAARAAYARGDLKSAIELYRTLSTTGPGQKRAQMFDPRYVLELARLLEKSGDVKGALVEYERFLGYWKGADAELAELSEARRAIGRLRSM